MPKRCSSCIWLSTGMQDFHGAGWCYSSGDYTDPESTCDFHQASLREEPLNQPMSPERLLIVRVGCLDKEVEG